MNANELYKAISKKSLPLIEAYHNNLIKHDRASIDRDHITPFIHFTGSTGTALVSLHAFEVYPKSTDKLPFLFGEVDRFELLDTIMGYIRALKNHNRMDLIQYYDGDTVKDITYEEALSIGQAYTDSMRQLLLK